MKNLTLIPTLAVVAMLLCNGCSGGTNKSAGGTGVPILATKVIATNVPVQIQPEPVGHVTAYSTVMVRSQIGGILSEVHFKEGDEVKSNAPLFTIDPRPMQAALARDKAQLENATAQFNRDQKLFEAKIESQDQFDASKASRDTLAATVQSDELNLNFTEIRAPFDGVVGDIPVHVGDFVAPTNSPASVLTTVDESRDLEAYIYVPTERSSQVRQGLDVELMDNSGKLLEKTKIDFISPEVDSTLQGILVKAPVHASPEMLRNAQMIKARVVWNTTPMAVVPVLAVTRQGGQSFVFVARQQNGHYAAIQTPVTLGDTVGNAYSITSGLNAGDRVIVSSTQYLVNGMAVMPLPGA